MRRILMGTGCCLGETVKYYLLEDAAGSIAKQYGISLECGNEQASLPGITVSQSRILALLDTLISGSVTPVSLRDVVEDWLLL